MNELINKWQSHSSLTKSLVLLDNKPDLWNNAKVIFGLNLVLFAFIWGKCDFAVKNKNITCFFRIHYPQKTKILRRDSEKTTGQFLPILTSFTSISGEQDFCSLFSRNCYWANFWKYLLKSFKVKPTTDGWAGKHNNMVPSDITAVQYPHPKRAKSIHWLPVQRVSLGHLRMRIPDSDLSPKSLQKIGQHLNEVWINPLETHCTCLKTKNQLISQ